VLELYVETYLIAQATDVAILIQISKVLELMNTDISWDEFHFRLFFLVVGTEIVLFFFFWTSDSQM
jgi:hypothetical protein